MKKKTVTGALIMAVVIILSVPLGANRSFFRLREDAMEAYYYDSTGYAVYSGLDSRVAAARNLVTVAERYVDGNPGLDPYIDELRYRADHLENMYEFRGCEEEVEANLLLGQAAEALYEQLEGIALEEKDEKYPTELIANIESEQDKLARSSYNDGAREYNEKLENSPVKLLAKLTGTEPMGVFE